MTENDIKVLMKKYLNGTISEKEESLLEEFDYKLLSKNHQKTFRNSRSKKTLKGKMAKEINHYKGKGALFKWTQIAASIAVLIGIVYFTFNFTAQETEEVPVIEVTKFTQWGQKLNLVLADGTEVYLNSGSSIKYPERFMGDTREVEFEGEAFFDVAKNPKKPFIIKTGEVKTEVLGTSFNVNAFAELQQIAVTVASGKVKVASKNTEVFLEPSEQGVFDKKTKSISKKEIDLVNFLHWKDGIIHFEDVELSKVLDTLERWYGVVFMVDDNHIGECHLTATYDNESLTAVLESIVYAKKGLSYQFLENKKIKILGKCTD